jgi:hypothetical protein
MNKSPGIPPALFGMDPTHTEPMYYGKVWEPSSFVVANHLPEDVKAAVRTDLWLAYTHEVTQNEWVPYFAQFGRHYVSYADPASLRMYRKLGWAPLHEVAEKYGIKNGNDPSGKFPTEPIEKEGVKWVPIYTNPMLLIQNEDANFFNPNARGRINAHDMERGLDSLAAATYHKGYDTNGRPITGEAVDPELRLNYPGAYLYALQKIVQGHGRGTTLYKGYFNFLSDQLYQVAILKDTLGKMRASDLEGSSERAVSFRAFKVQAEEFLKFYGEKVPTIKIELLKHLEDCFRSCNSQQKAETLNGLNSLLQLERWTPGVLDLIGLMSKVEARQLLTHIKNPQEDSEVLRYFSRAQSFVEP